MTFVRLTSIGKMSRSTTTLSKEISEPFIRINCLFVVSTGYDFNLYVPRSNNTVRNTVASDTDRNNLATSRKTGVFLSYTVPFYRAESHELVYRANAAVLRVLTRLLRSVSLAPVLRSVYGAVLFDLGRYK